MVGVDGSPESLTAVQVAAVEADRVDRQLTVVTSLTDATTEDDPATTSALEQLSSAYPGLAVSRVVDRERTPVQSLLSQAAGAFLLVIGRHGRGARPGMLLGSVTHTVLLAPPCPTLVITPHLLPASALPGVLA